MQTRMIQSISRVIVLALILVFFPYLAQAGQSESPVPCDESGEPILLNYGDHTTDCGISPATDLDQFTFVGSAGDNIRIVVRQTSGLLDPRLEIRDPQGNEIFNDFCYDACTVRADLSLTNSGTYHLAISDEVSDQTGNYTLQLEKIPPVQNPPGILYNISVNDTISPVTDVDFFTFEGAEGTDVQIVVRQTSGLLDPRLEIRDPQGNEIFNDFCYDACTVQADLSLANSGTYHLIVSDEVSDQTGDYQINIQCLFGDCPDFLPPHTVCDIQMSQASYTVGDTVIAQVARIANPGPDPVAIEIKTWFEGPEIPSTPDINMGWDGTFVLSPGDDQDFGPMPLVTVTPDITLGTYEYNCRVLDPVTGRQLTLDRNPFDIE